MGVIFFRSRLDFYKLLKSQKNKKIIFYQYFIKKILQWSHAYL